MLWVIRGIHRGCILHTWTWNLSLRDAWNVLFDATDTPILLLKLKLDQLKFLIEFRESLSSLGGIGGRVYHHFGYYVFHQPIKINCFLILRGSTSEMTKVWHRILPIFHINFCICISLIQFGFPHRNDLTNLRWIYFMEDTGCISGKTRGCFMTSVFH